jgi:hypothetical protein
MEEGRQKSKRLSYKAKFKRVVIRCAKDKGNGKADAVFGVDESNVRIWSKHKAAISGCEATGKKFTGPKEGRFPEILMMQSSRSCMRDARMDCLWVMVCFARMRDKKRPDL